MKKINIDRLFYKIRHKYFNLNNAVIAIGLMISVGWVFGSLDVMQKNYNLQKELDNKARQLIVAEIDMASAKLEQRYYKTDEYKEYAARKYLGLGTEGEKVLILPPNSKEVKELSQDKVSSDSFLPEEKSNFQQWIDFLFGVNAKNINN